MESNVMNLSYGKHFQIRTPHLGHLGVDKCLEEIRYVLQVRDLGKKRRGLFVKGLSTPTGLLLLKKHIISQQDQEMYAQWIHIEAYPYLREMFGMSSCVMLLNLL